MSTNNFGEISWQDDIFGGNSEKKFVKDLFLRLDNGSNEVRLLTQPFQYLCHKYKKEGDKGYGTKVNCCAANGPCPLCEMGDKAKPRWLLGVISRKTGTYKILDVSYAVFQGIRKLAQNTQRWGDPTKYDIDISFNKNASKPNDFYAVSPVPKEPLSAADQQIRDNEVDLEDLKRRATPPTVEQVQKKLDKINGIGEGQTVAPTAQPQLKKDQTKNKVVKQVAMEEDETEEFPSYDAQS